MKKNLSLCERVDLLSFDKYIKSSSLRKSLHLTSNGLLSFHWANWEKTCLYLKRKLENNCAETTHKYELILQEIDELKKTPIWLKGKRKIVQATVCDLYQAYLDPRMRHHWFDNTDEIQVSLIHEAGPYIMLSSMRWLDFDTYTLFVRAKILSDSIMLRKFRLTLDIPVLIYFDDSPLHQSYITFCQGSEDGVLMRIEKHADLLKMVRSSKINLEIPLSYFIKSQGCTVPEIINIFSSISSTEMKKSEQISMSLKTSLLSSYDNMKNIKRSSGECYYFFARYQDFLVESTFYRDDLSPLKNTILKFERHFSRILDDVA